MNTNSFYPLRRSAGRPIPIGSVRILFASAAFEPQLSNLNIVHRHSLADTVTDPAYREFFPDLVIGTGAARQVLAPAVGAWTLPLPPASCLPFGDAAPLSLWALTSLPYSRSDDISRKLSVTLEIEFRNEMPLAGENRGACQQAWRDCCCPSSR